MEAGFIVLAIVTAIIGVIVGTILEKRKHKKRESRGVLFVEYSDPDHDPGMFLKASVPADVIASQKEVLFDVRVIGQFSRK